MKLASTRALITTLAALAFAGCGSAPVGTWKFSGFVPNSVDATLILGADGKYTLDEKVAPVTTPVGWHPGSCATMQLTSGTYVAGNGTLKFKFVSGTANVVSGCDDPSQDLAGTPMTAEGLASYTSQGMFPPSDEKYSESSTELTLEPGFGFSGLTKLSKAP